MNLFLQKYYNYIKLNKKRILLFLIGCMGLRLFMGLFIKSNYCNRYMCSMLSITLLLIGIGFLVIYFGDLRKSGIETGGQPIWWNNLRPFHGLIYCVSGLLILSNSIVGKFDSVGKVGSFDFDYKNLAGNLIIIDAVVGLIAWKWYHLHQITPLNI